MNKTFKVGDKIRPLPEALKTYSWLKPKAYEVGAVIPYLTQDFICLKDERFNVVEPALFTAVTDFDSTPKVGMPVTTPTVHELRKRGNDVHVCHCRELEQRLNWELGVNELKPKPCGGKTIVEITNKEGETVRGEAICHPKDNYCKKVGVKLAIERALATQSEPVKPEQIVTERVEFRNKMYALWSDKKLLHVILEAPCQDSEHTLKGTVLWAYSDSIYKIGEYIQVCRQEYKEYLDKVELLGS